MGLGQGLVDSTFNNFLKETFQIGNLERAILELPRELPGFLTVFFFTFLSFTCPRRIAALANLFCAIGIFLIGFFSPSFNFMLIWLFIVSTGQHLFLPLNSSLGIDLAPVNRPGKMLGFFAGVQNLAAVAASLVIFLGFSFLKFSFTISYLISALAFLFAALFLFMMKPAKATPRHRRLKFKKEYKLYYWLTVLYGTRKQIFLTFAPWVLVKVFEQPTSFVAMLLFGAGIGGIIFKPILGRLIDKLGERFILSGEAALLIFVCLGYGFAKSILPFNPALILASLCYILDYLLMSVSMARATYLAKIALDPEEVAPTLSLATSLDHIFSITIALTGGVLWAFLGYEAVFMLGAVIALLNFVSALRIKIKQVVIAG